MRKLYLTLFLALLIVAVKAQVNTLNEGFNGPSPVDWATQNLSSPVGASLWTSGAASSALPGHQGAGHAVVNFNSTTGAGDISNWFFSPQVNLKDGATLTFFTRTSSATPTYPDRMEVRLSTAGASVNAGASSTSVGDFTILACSINPTLSDAATSTGGCGNPYPQAWTQYVITVSGVGSTPVAGRIAFRYFVTNAGPSGDNSNIIGLDELVYDVNGGLCGTPSNVNVNAITQTSATVNWTVPGVGTPVNYDVYYSTSSTDPISSTTPTITGATGTSANLSPLVINTPYYVWVRTNCGATKSAWSSAVAFSTLCAPTATFPYTMPISAATPPALPACTQVLDANADGNKWVSANFTTPPPGVTNPVMVYFYSSVNAANDWLFTQALTLTGGRTYILAFKYNNDGSVPADGVNYYPEKLRVKYGSSATAAGMTNTLADYPTLSSATVQTASINFTPSATGDYYIGFQAYSDADMDAVYLDDITVTAGPFPVTLAEFTGERQGSINKLTWKTSTESNNKGFDLERSADGRNFTSIAFVASKAENGSSAATLNYSFDDVKPLKGTNYYRLKQMDKDGKFTYSQIVTLKTKASDIEITAFYPNPTRRELNLVINSPSTEKLTIVITDITGKTVMQKSVNVVIGDNQQTLNVQQLNAGTYLIKAICDNGCETTVQRFVKQ